MNPAPASLHGTHGLVALLAVSSGEMQIRGS